MFSHAQVATALALEDKACLGHLASELCLASKNGEVASVDELIKRGADVRFQDEEMGRSALMLAAEKGFSDVVSLLLSSGAPWNAQDRREQSAGDYARSSGHQPVVDMLLEWACLAEDVLREGNAQEVLEAENVEYLSQKLEYNDDKLMDANGEAVMMEWEKPLMIAHANLICQNGGDILNVGFGLGLVDDAIQGYQPRSHTIIEAHPDVYKHMIELGWDKKPNVKILFGRWKDVADQLGQFDGIFFDTYAEHYDHMRAFHDMLPRILRKDGIYSFFNGLAPRCEFFHEVYCRMVARELANLGLATQYIQLPVAVDEDSGWDKNWEGVKNRYWFHRTYHLPVVYFDEEEEADKPKE